LVKFIAKQALAAQHRPLLPITYFEYFLP